MIISLLTRQLGARRLTALLFVSGLVLALPAHAQLDGVPVWSPGLPNVMAPNAALFAIHTTSGDDFVGSETNADWGVTGAYRRLLFERVTATVGGGLIRRDVAQDDRAWKPQLFISAAVNVIHLRDSAGDFEGGLSPFAGVGYSDLSGSASEQNIPLGLDFTGIAAMGGWFIEAWVLPRWSWRRTSLAGTSHWQDGFGVSGGFTVGFAIGLAVQLAVDKVYLGTSSEGTDGPPKTKPLSWSFGFRWAK